MEEFKLALRDLVYPVCIISGKDSKDNCYAITISSVTSVSFDPPSILACINKDSLFSQILVEDHELNLSFLKSNQKEIANICSLNKERFDNNFWNYESNTPFITDAQSAITTKISKIFDHGTHKIIIMNVKKVIYKNNKIDPLLYGNQKYLNINS